MTEPDWAALEVAWTPARLAGVLGTASLEELREHAAGYLPAACAVQDEFLGVDLGTGAGVPGILLALARPRSRWLLVDASERRCALAEAAVRAVGLSPRVEVRHARAEAVAGDPAWRGRGDLVVARSFGPPPELAECALPLVAPTGRLVVSVTSATEAVWRAAEPPDDLGFVVSPAWTTDRGRYLAVESTRPPAARYPRRAAARRRVPLF